MLVDRVPVGWEQLELGDLFDFKNGVNADKSAYGEEIQFINVFEVINNESLTEDMIPGCIKLPSSLKNKYRVEYGDVLFNRTSETQEEVELASVYLGSSEVLFGGFVFRARPKTNRLDANYSKYALRSQLIRDQIVARGQGGIRANISQRDLSRVRVSLPQPCEQREIAQFLTDIDDLICSIEILISKKLAIKQGMMQELLTGKTRLPGFLSEWATTTLGELGAFFKGRGVKRDEVRSSGIPCIRYGELYTTYQDYTFSTVSFVDDQVASTALPLRSGDLLFAGSGETRQEIGICVAYLGKGPAVAGGDIVVLRGTGFNPVYLASLMNTPPVVVQKSRYGQGDAVVHISSGALAKIEVRIPPQEEQDAIASTIMDLNQEVVILRARLEKTEFIKQGMMQELLTGRTRLPIKEAAI